MPEAQADPPREIIAPEALTPAVANYSPAVRVGSHVYVSGLIAMRDGVVIAPGDAAVQTAHVIEQLEEVLERAGASLGDIVRYRIYLTDIADLADVRSALAPVFGTIRPAGTLVAVSGLVHPDLKIEIDVDAIIGSALDNTRSDQT
jgi:enamine deaminase RidA (YjgF/YER057c/UK114 family)